MKPYAVAVLAAILAFYSLSAQAAIAPSADEVVALLGGATQVEEKGAGHYAIDGEDVSLAQLLGNILPRKEETLRTIAGNIQQRLATSAQVASGASLDIKRGQCQAMAMNSIDRTRCYQELESLRDQQTLSSGDAASRRRDDQQELDRLNQEIQAIEKFRHQYGAGSSIGPAPVPPR